MCKRTRGIFLVIVLLTVIIGALSAKEDINRTAEKKLKELFTLGFLVQRSADTDYLPEIQEFYLEKLKLYINTKPGLDYLGPWKKKINLMEAGTASKTSKELYHFHDDYIRQTLVLDEQIDFYFGARTADLLYCIATDQDLSPFAKDFLDCSTIYYFNKLGFREDLIAIYKLLNEDSVSQELVLEHALSIIKKCLELPDDIKETNLCLEGRIR